MRDDLSFDWIIQPVDTATFFKDYYERRTLLVERRDPDYYGDLLDIAAIERHIATQSPRHPDVVLVDARQDLDHRDYCFADGQLDARRAFQRFADGATIVLNHLRPSPPGVAALVHAAEQRFSCPLQANVYLTPPGAQGFHAHYDCYDVFILQVAGSKRWATYDTKIELPLIQQDYVRERDKPGPVSAEFTLHQGDLFYCPRGLMHDARSTDQASLHITLTVMAKTWAELMIETVAMLCLEDPAFRRNLPVGFANSDHDPETVHATFADLVRRLGAAGKPDRVLDTLALDFIRTRAGELDGQIAQLAGLSRLTLDTPVGARPHLVYRLVDAGAQVHLICQSAAIAYPAVIRPTLIFALSTPSFRPRDLQGLADESKLSMVRGLIREGFVRTL